MSSVLRGRRTPEFQTPLRKGVFPTTVGVVAAFRVPGWCYCRFAVVVITLMISFSKSVAKCSEAFAPPCPVRRCCRRPSWPCGTSRARCTTRPRAACPWTARPRASTCSCAPPSATPSPRRQLLRFGEHIPRSTSVSHTFRCEIRVATWTQSTALLFPASLLCCATARGPRHMRDQRSQFLSGGKHLLRDHGPSRSGAAWRWFAFHTLRQLLGAWWDVSRARRDAARERRRDVPEAHMFFQRCIFLMLYSASNSLLSCPTIYV